jgi:hypothetical protein
VFISIYPQSRRWRVDCERTNYRSRTSCLNLTSLFCVVCVFTLHTDANFEEKFKWTPDTLVQRCTYHSFHYLLFIFSTKTLKIHTFAKLDPRSKRTCHYQGCVLWPAYFILGRYVCLLQSSLLSDLVLLKNSPNKCKNKSNIHSPQNSNWSTLCTFFLIDAFCTFFSFYFQFS